MYVPEKDIDFEKECGRLRTRMDENDCVNIFLSEGAGIDTIVREKEAVGEEVARDAFGHVKLDFLDLGEWFSQQFGDRLGAGKILVQKSGYFARSAAPNAEDLDLIRRSAALAAKSALNGQNGVVGLDMEVEGEMALIDFSRIRGGKPFDTQIDWFQSLLKGIGQA